MQRGDRRVLLIAVALTVAIGLLDYLTPAQVDFTEFYMIPVVIVAWILGWKSGLAFGLVGAGVEFVVDDLLRDLNVATALWNGISRIGVFVALALVTDRLYRERTAKEAAYEQERRRWQQLDAQRSTLLAVLGREFQRPLRALDWFARTFEESLVRNSTEAMRTHYRALRHQIQDIAFLGTDLIAVGSMEPSALRLDPKIIDLKRLIAEAADESPARPRVLLSLVSEPMMVLADADRLRQAIAALIDRCLELAPHDDVTVLARLSGDEVAVEIDSRTRELDAADLVLAQFLVAANGGRLVLISRGAMRGSKVTVHLPLASPAAVKANQTAAEDAPRR